MTRLPSVRRDAPMISASAVAVGVADFIVRTEAERMRLFRLHLDSTVLQVSPLLPELASMEGIGIHDAAALISPPQDWPWRPIYDPPSPTMRQWQHRRFLLGRDAERGAGRFRRAFASPGLIIRDVDHPRGRFAIRPSGGVLGFTAAIGPALLSSFGVMAVLRLPEPLPETLVLAMPGRKLGQLVDHPLFRDRDYMVRRVVTDPSDDLPVLEFKVPLVPFAIRWPEDES